ncbi:exoenzyme regulatory protein AepA in lipid-linked oligosaccharide synthesis cluster [Lachnospiraceae bacterium KM106-2]|nr:exoenzyme regulatory protein AepA in lipid-linked oligosaccharide synthesis cluster [Lachnospiraceae bacterium KM106-2]
MKQIFYNAKILTMDDSNPFADSMLVEDGIIKWVGRESDLAGHNDSSTICHDMNGCCILPAFIDPHSHITSLAYQLLMVNVSGPPVGSCKTIADIIAKCKQRLVEKPPAEGEWLLATGYDPLSLTDEGSLTRHELDEISNSCPVCVMHISGHIAVLNTLALSLVGYGGDDFTVPQGGEVELEADGVTANGVIKEQAWLTPTVSSKISVPSVEQVLSLIKEACHIYSSNGIATCQDARTGKKEYELLQYAANNHLLSLDVVSYISDQNAQELLGDFNPYESRDYHNHYRIAGYKTFLDGSPQGKTAWLSKPYYVPPEHQGKDYCGFPTQKDEEIYEKCKTCIEHDWQINAHCNGDAACEQYITAYQKALADTQNPHDLRPVMIHAQTVRLDQLDKMKEIGMMPSYFLDHIYYWGDAHYESILGPERAQRISPLRSTLLKGMNATFHQDTPVVMPNMLLSIHNAVNRKTYRGRILGENECVSVMDALKCATINGAYQIFEEDKKGTLTKGKLADFVLLKENPLEVQKEHLKEIQILATYKEGTAIYQKDPTQ